MIKRLTSAECVDPVTGFFFSHKRNIKETVELHDHDFYEFLFILEGEMDYEINGTHQRISRGFFSFIRPEDRHTYRLRGKQEYQLFNLTFNTETLAALTNYLSTGFDIDKLLKSAQAPYVILPAPEIERLRKEFEQFNLIPVTHTEELKTRLRVLLAYLFIHYFCEWSSTEQSDIPLWLQQTCQPMKQRENFTRGLERFYHLAPCSPEHLTRSFKKHFGMKPTEWINDIRLNYVANLLTYSEDNVTSIVSDAGFENLSHFYHLFKQRFQTSPARYRNTHRKSMK